MTFFFVFIKACQTDIAGDLRISNGYIKRLSNASGHYFPSISEAENFSEIFKLLNLNLKKAWIDVVWLEGEKVLNKTTKIN